MAKFKSPWAERRPGDSPWMVGSEAHWAAVTPSRVASPVSPEMLAEWTRWREEDSAAAPPSTSK
eukprot:SAG31_NODE_2573_length_5458_cov_1.552528_2_plen_64_part_00